MKMTNKILKRQQCDFSDVFSSCLCFCIVLSSLVDQLALGDLHIVVFIEALVSMIEVRSIPCLKVPAFI